MFDSTESIITVVVVILIAYAVVLSVGAIYWTYRDVRARTRDGGAQAVSILLVAIFNIPGLLLYLILRPNETLHQAHERRLPVGGSLAVLMPSRTRYTPPTHRPGMRTSGTGRGAHG